MSIFNWFSSKSAPPQSSSLPSDGLSVPPHASEMPSKPNLITPSLKVKRQDRREQLYKVVRDVMLRAEILAATYKFKVLSLDIHGRQFLIMVDLLDPLALPQNRFAEIEKLMISAATLRHDLLIKSVYWRLNTPAVAAVSSVKPAARQGSNQPIDQDEVLAFKKAVAQSTDKLSQGATGKLVASGPRYQALNKGFEDTLILESEVTASPLSNTQYGDL
jgi:hypothetical protein